MEKDITRDIRGWRIVYPDTISWNPAFAGPFVRINRTGQHRKDERREHDDNLIKSTLRTAGYVHDAVIITAASGKNTEQDVQPSVIVFVNCKKVVWKGDSNIAQLTHQIQENPAGVLEFLMRV